MKFNNKIKIIVLLVLVLVFLIVFVYIKKEKPEVEEEKIEVESLLNEERREMRSEIVEDIELEEIIPLNETEKQERLNSILK